MKTIFEVLLEDYILPEQDKEKQLRIARAVLEGNALLERVRQLEYYVRTSIKPPFQWLPNAKPEGRWLGSEINKYPGPANSTTRARKPSNHNYTWTHSYDSPKGP